MRTFIRSLGKGMCLILLGMLYSCSAYFHQPMKPGEARLGAETPQTKELQKLPAPKEKVIAAVYKFRDQSGQYKMLEAGSSWSTAVTQGATSILLKALEESGWFIPIEREGLANLLNERKIIRSSRANYTGGGADEQLIPPLLFAGVVLEGGIISYDSNVITGGAGLKYFGTGGSGQYREDRITIYLRAVSTSSGRILKTVYVTKTILSQKVDVGVFRYVKYQRLLEAESGFTFNEPTEMAVKEAIEKAVVGLIIEGIEEGLWPLENPEEFNNPVVQGYIEERDINPNSDIFGEIFRARRGWGSVALTGGSLIYEGDIPGKDLGSSLRASFSYNTTGVFSAQVNYGIGKWITKYNFEQNINYMDFQANFRFLPRSTFTPYVILGGGVTSLNKGDLFNFNNTFKGTLYAHTLAGVGLEYLISDRIGLHGDFTHRYYFDDNVDEYDQGNYNDWVWGAEVGVRYYFGMYGKKKERKKLPKKE